MDHFVLEIEHHTSKKQNVGKSIAVGVERLHGNFLRDRESWSNGDLTFDGDVMVTGWLRNGDAVMVTATMVERSGTTTKFGTSIF